MSAGVLLRRDREAKGYTQRQVAERVGIDHTYLSKIENDHVQPGDGLLAYLANLYGTNMRSYQVRYGIMPPGLGRRAVDDVIFASIL